MDKFEYIYIPMKPLSQSKSEHIHHPQIFSVPFIYLFKNIYLAAQDLPSSTCHAWSLIVVCEHLIAACGI